MRNDSDDTHAQTERLQLEQTTAKFLTLLAREAGVDPPDCAAPPPLLAELSESPAPPRRKRR